MLLWKTEIHGKTPAREEEGVDGAFAPEKCDSTVWLVSIAGAEEAPSRKVSTRMPWVERMAKQTAKFGTAGVSPPPNPANEFSENIVIC
jgi:hypothetical protein